MMSKKKPLNFERFFAPVARLELATRGLTVHCSNQLSYTGINYALYEPENLVQVY